MSARYGLIENETIVNVIVASKEFIEEFYPNYIELDDFASTGDSYINGKSFRPEITNPRIDDAETL